MDALTLLKSGDWNSLFKRYNRYVLVCVGHNEDLSQEVWIRVVLNQDKFLYGKFTNWISAIASSVKQDHLRKKFGKGKSGSITYRKPSFYSMDSIYLSKIFGNDGEDNFVSVKDNKEQAERNLKMIGEAVDSLPEKQRDVVILRSCKSFSEISGIMGASLATSLQRMSYAKKHIRSVIKNQTVAA